jgi:hypothetical protein
VKTILLNVLIAIITILVIFIVILLDYPKRKNRELFYHVIVKFVGGNKTKLVLNAEQYEQLQATLNQKDGFYEIGDDLDNIKFYREHVCAVEVKKK